MLSLGYNFEVSGHKNTVRVFPYNLSDANICHFAESAKTTQMEISGRVENYPRFLTNLHQPMYISIIFNISSVFFDLFQLNFAMLSPTQKGALQTIRTRFLFPFRNTITHLKTFDFQPQDLPHFCTRFSGKNGRHSNATRVVRCAPESVICHDCH